MKSAEIKL